MAQLHPSLLLPQGFIQARTETLLRGYFMSLVTTFLRDLVAIPANLRRMADAVEALTKKYAPPAPPDPRYTPRLHPSDK